MYEKQRVIKELEEYISAADIFQILKKEKDLAFLDSSLVNQLGRYSVIGRKPYLKLVKDGGKFYINNIEETDITFEDYLRKYLRKNEDKNTTELPLISGAVGYFSYEYGRKLMQVTSSEKDIVSIPDASAQFFMICL